MNSQSKYYKSSPKRLIYYQDGDEWLEKGVYVTQIDRRPVESEQESKEEYRRNQVVEQPRGSRKGG